MASLGPTIIFDKSMLQSLSEDESVWLDAFYHSILTPLFYVETLADLTKKTESKSPEDIVRIISNKVPDMGSSPNSHHRTLSIGNLLGYKVDLSRRPILSGGKSYVLNNKIGVVYDEHPELKAFNRWGKREFFEIEKEIASLWRRALAEFDYDHCLNLVKLIIGPSFKKPKNLEEAFESAVRVVNGEGHRYKTLQLFKYLFDINNETFKDIVRLWNKQDMIPISHYAPYTAHVIKIDIFFILCTSSGLISRERSSNRADVAYLYYLPFTNIFTSSDKLHRRIVPFFLEPDQRFIWGEDLKNDLSKLDNYFDQLKTESEKQKGVYDFAWYPPNNETFLTSRMWDELRPSWRLQCDKPRGEASSKNQKVPDGLTEHIKKAYQEIKKQKGKDIPKGFDLEDANDVIIKRMVKGRRGKWQLFSDKIMQSKERLSDE